MNAFAPGLLAGAAGQNVEQRGHDSGALSALLAAAGTPGELYALAANEIRQLAGARQVFFFRCTRHAAIEAVSGLAAVNRASPTIIELQRSMNSLWQAGELTAARLFRLGGGQENDHSALAAYPYKAMLWLPVRSLDGAVAGGLLLARDAYWGQDDVRLLEPLAKVAGEAIGGAERSAARQLIDVGRTALARKSVLVLVVAAAAMMAFPVSMTVKAPFQIVGADSVVVSAPLDGVIKEVLVGPGDAVTQGQPLLRLDDLQQQNRIALAREELSLAEARFKQAGQLSFESAEGRKELGLRMAEVAVKRAELQLAQEQIERTVLKARRDGVVLLTDAHALIGKPVVVGERIMEVSDPSKIEAAIDLPVHDSIALKLGASAKLFLDSAPFNARTAVIGHVGYQAASLPSGTLAYRLRAELADQSNPPKLGVRGTAKVYGDTVPLAFYLFRRPIALVRQWLGF